MWFYLAFRLSVGVKLYLRQYERTDERTDAGNRILCNLLANNVNYFPNNQRTKIRVFVG